MRKGEECGMEGAYEEKVEEKREVEKREWQVEEGADEREVEEREWMAGGRREEEWSGGEERRG